MTVIAKSTLKPELFVVLRTLILANKPTYTYNSGTITYTLLASFPRVNPVFPCVVLNESSVTISKLTLDSATFEYVISVQLDFYAPELHGQKAIGTAQSALANTFLGNSSTFDTSNGLVFAEVPWEDSNIDQFTNGVQVLHTGSSTVRFILK